jgi:DNA-binding NarL/FixJ family response regulator
MIRLEIPTPSAVLFATGAAGEGDDSHSDSAERRAGELNLRFLIVEDEAVVALNMEAALIEAGFEIVGTVDTEAAAVTAAFQLRPDVIIMDITLREGDGIQAARAIEKKLKTQIVFVSGNSDPGTLSAAHALRPAGFIRKPFLTERFASLVMDAVSRAG